jgi:hypothetical protein
LCTRGCTQRSTIFAAASCESDNSKKYSTGAHAVPVAQVDAPGTVRFASYLGVREYPHCTSAGKALLSALPPERARALAVEAGLPPRTPRTITDPDALTHDLEVSAARGYAIDDEEDCEGVFCVGAAVYDRSGECVAAVSGTGLKLNRPTWRWTNWAGPSAPPPTSSRSPSAVRRSPSAAGETEARRTTVADHRALVISEPGVIGPASAASRVSRRHRGAHHRAPAPAVLPGRPHRLRAALAAHPRLQSTCGYRRRLICREDRAMQTQNVLIDGLQIRSAGSGRS